MMFENLCAIDNRSERERWIQMRKGWWRTNVVGGSTAVQLAENDTHLPTFTNIL